MNSNAFGFAECVLSFLPHFGVLIVETSTPSLHSWVTLLAAHVLLIETQSKRLEIAFALLLCAPWLPLDPS